MYLVSFQHLLVQYVITIFANKSFTFIQDQWSAITTKDALYVYFVIRRFGILKCIFKWYVVFISPWPVLFAESATNTSLSQWMWCFTEYCRVSKNNMTSYCCRPSNIRCTRTWNQLTMSIIIILLYRWYNTWSHYGYYIYSWYHTLSHTRDEESQLEISKTSIVATTVAEASDSRVDCLILWFFKLPPILQRFVQGGVNESSFNVWKWIPIYYLNICLHH